MFEVIYRKRALKGLARMPAALRERAREALALLAANPDRHGLDVRSLQGRDGFRLRIGDWRLLYQVDRGRLIILVVEVGPRGEVYK